MSTRRALLAFALTSVVAIPSGLAASGLGPKGLGHVDAMIVSAQYASAGGLQVVLDRGTSAGVAVGASGRIYQDAQRSRALLSPRTGRPVELRVIEAGGGSARARIDTPGVTLEQLMRTPYARVGALR
jgi:hypothetical protein